MWSLNVSKAVILKNTLIVGSEYLSDKVEN